MELVFVTNNPNKLNEIQSLVSNDIDIKSLKDINFHDEIDETELTLEGNALLKARHIHSKFGLDCFADDTGKCARSVNKRNNMDLKPHLHLPNLQVINYIKHGACNLGCTVSCNT